MGAGAGATRAGAWLYSLEVYPSAGLALLALLLPTVPPGTGPVPRLAFVTPHDGETVVAPVATELDLAGGEATVSVTAGGRPIAELRSPPYRLDWSPTEAGPVALAASATLADGRRLTARAAIDVVRADRALAVGLVLTPVVV